MDFLVVFLLKDGNRKQHQLTARIKYFEKIPFLNSSFWYSTLHCRPSRSAHNHKKSPLYNYESFLCMVLYIAKKEKIAVYAYTHRRGYDGRIAVSNNVKCSWSNLIKQCTANKKCNTYLLDLFPWGGPPQTTVFSCCHHFAPIPTTMINRISQSLLNECCWCCDWEKAPCRDQFLFCSVCFFEFAVAYSMGLSGFFSHIPPLLWLNTNTRRLKLL